MTSKSLAAARSRRASDPATLAENYFVLLCMALSDLPLSVAGPLAIDRAEVLLEMALQQHSQPLPLDLQEALHAARQTMPVLQADEHGVEVFPHHVQSRTKSA